ncbi:hypothetical protein [Pseudooceanicola aestuarii]|uniref:hypothetical protein n=1 Tax=Pseudooceanicola aestuarii TaxID=2697319 RepID=UPI0013CF4D10|nr:hypothetical protein [Pseudooceanicola aestuarii]
MIVVLLLATVVIYGIGLTNGVDIGREEVGFHTPYAQVNERELARCNQLEGTARDACIITAMRASQHRDFSFENLLVQRDMSKWTLWMLIVSAGMLVTAVLGTIGILGTLIETRKAVRTAQDANASAREAVGVTQTIGEAQTRAYVSVRQLIAMPIPDSTGTRLIVEIQNTGATPARGLELIILGKRVASYAKKQVSFRDQPPTLKNTDLGAGSTPKTYFRDYPDLSHQEIMLTKDQDAHKLFCFVYIKYFDVFDPKRERVRRTIASAQYDGGHFVHNGVLAMNDCERGNRST